MEQRPVISQTEDLMAMPSVREENQIAGPII